MSNIPIYSGRQIKKVGFVGLGKSNLGVFRFLRAKYSEIEFTARFSKGDGAHTGEFCRVMTGINELSDIDEDILFLSPSVRRDKRELSLARERGVILSSDSEFFLNSTDSDIYAITGSDGKSTTTSLTAHLLSAGYDFAIPCGNIGEPLTPHLDDPRGGAYAVELSSFQLMYSMPKSKRAVITNITKNHLDWHSSFDEYISAKKNLLENSKELIFNLDCPISREIAKHYKPFAVFSLRKSEDELRSLISSELYITQSADSITACGERLASRGCFPLKGEHNTANLMAALALTYGTYESEKTNELLLDFKGLAHRFEHFLTQDGVKYIDSSIDSSPGRTVRTLAMAEGNIILILGGKSKGLDYRELLPAMGKNIRLIILTGESGDEIEAVFREFELMSEKKLPHIRIPDFYDAADYAVRSAKRDDTVILSPASTSYDRFKNFEERGNAFKDFIKERTLSQGSKI